MTNINSYVYRIDSVTDFLENINGEILLLVDENVDNIYSNFWKKYKKIIVPSGESSKSFDFVPEVINKLLALNAHRNTILVGIGGGVTTDITGFVASVYKRGLDFIYLPTTLLSMCDAALGGKNGINAHGVKNCVGTINQPQKVAIFPDFLHSLSKFEFQNGLGEVIKHALLDGTEHVDFLINNAEKIKNLDTDTVNLLIDKSIDVKMKIVQNDVHENGERRLLNFGHTIGHAIETTSYLSHGECVAVGIYLDTKMSLKQGFCQTHTFDITTKLLDIFDFNYTIDLDFETLEEKILNDKKKYNEDIFYVFPFDIGDCRSVKIKYFDLIEQLKMLIHG